MPLTGWLDWLAVASLATGVGCSLIIIIDMARGHRQHMHVMEWVWPITALWSGPFGLYWYFRLGRLATDRRVRRAQRCGRQPPGAAKPQWQASGLSAFHCGAGCTLGDIIAETFLLFVPMSLFGHEIFAAWVVDFVLAFGLGIAFQYFTIAPMRDLGVIGSLKAAIKADTLSLGSWQFGMYGWMAIATFVLFGQQLDKTGALFWFMMQIAMVTGFLTAYPVNWWLLRVGIKEKMN